MAEEMTQDNVQENQETSVENKQESPSDPSLLQEIMAKKEKIRTLESELAKKNDAEEKGRQKKLAEEGKYKELDAEKTATIEKLMSENEYAKKIIAQQKIDIINSLTSDDEEREELATKDLETLRFIQNKFGNKAINNPQESLGSVRTANNMAGVDWTTQDPKERRDSWSQHVANAKK